MPALLNPTRSRRDSGGREAAVCPLSVASVVSVAAPGLTEPCP